MLRLNTDENDVRWIDNTHSVFQGTDFEHVSFRVKVKPITRLQIARITKKHTSTKKGVRIVDEIMVQQDQFIECVQEWEDIFGADKDGEGKPIPLECNNETKSIISNLNPLFAAYVVESAGGLSEQGGDSQEKN